jgi:hypothetical protein
VSIDTLNQRCRQIRRTLDQQVGEARSLAVTGQRLTTETASLRQQIDLLDRATGLLTSIGEERQATAQTQIEALVTRGLATIFGSDLSFHLVAVVRGKRPEVDFVVRSKLGDTVVDTDVIDARGGGLAATVGFLLRLVVLLLAAKPGADSVLILDETFAHVSAEYEPGLAEFLAELVARTGVQIIMVTHSDVYSEHADTRYRFTLKDGVTTVAAV